MNPNNRRIAKNVIFLYIRMLFIMLVTFYMSRLTLAVLGVSDYGIYNVVGGIVVMFSMITSPLISAVNRFFTIELGRGNKERLNVLFSSSVNIHVVLSVVIFIIAELSGIWFLHNKMNIPGERMAAADWVFHCSLLTFVVNFISVPYNAIIIAYERMKAFAYISILDVILKLGVTVFLLLRLYDGLIVYAVLLFIEAVVIRIIYGIYCRKNFSECRYRFVYDVNSLKEMMAFAGWNFVGVTSGILRDQGINILLNLFFGPIVNAARAISVQVGTAINSFAGNFMNGLNPQIIKSYSIGDNNYMMSLVYRGTRFSYYLLLFFSLPILQETGTVLHVWLKSVPDHTILFVRLMLVFVLSESISQPLVTSMFATGKIRNYQIVVGGTQMLIFPVSYLALKLGASPETPLYITIFFSQVCLFLRLFMLRGMIGLRITDYVRKVYLNILYVSIVAGIFPLAISRSLPDCFLKFLSVTILCMANTALVVYGIGCSKDERCMIRYKSKEFICKLLGR